MNNIDIYKLENVKVINGDCNTVLFQITDHDVVFIDPPWQLSLKDSYKQYTNLRLTIGQESIENLCNKLVDEKYMKKIPRLVVLKLPKNYDVAHFYKNVVNNKNIYYYDLTKMVILVIMI
jgi:site-specific DNA-adenine methylase